MQRQRDDFLTLSTVHSAKGLEWPIVIIIWATEGRFPLLRLRNIEALEEERRLMYVAATRAKDHLVICYPGDEELPFWESGYYSLREDNLSSFLKQIPSDLYVYRDLGQKKKKRKKKDSLFSSGDKVRHPSFGIGIVSKVISQEKVEVIFFESGKKLLHLAYTRLEKV